jgi:hypothetical protein
VRQALQPADECAASTRSFRPACELTLVLQLDGELSQQAWGAKCVQTFCFFSPPAPRALHSCPRSSLILRKRRQLDRETCK